MMEYILTIIRRKYLYIVFKNSYHFQNLTILNCCRHLETQHECTKQTVCFCSHSHIFSDSCLCLDLQITTFDNDLLIVNQSGYVAWPYYITNRPFVWKTLFLLFFACFIHVNMTTNWILVVRVSPKHRLLQNESLIHWSIFMRHAVCSHLCFYCQSEGVPIHRCILYWIYFIIIFFGNSLQGCIQAPDNDLVENIIMLFSVCTRVDHVLCSAPQVDPGTAWIWWHVYDVCHWNPRRYITLQLPTTLQTNCICPLSCLVKFLCMHRHFVDDREPIGSSGGKPIKWPALKNQ